MESISSLFLTAYLKSLPGYPNAMPQLTGRLAARAVPSPSSFQNAFSSRASGSAAWMASCYTAPAAAPMYLETPLLHEGPRPGAVTAETNLTVALVTGDSTRAGQRFRLTPHSIPLKGWHCYTSQHALPNPMSRCPPALPTFARGRDQKGAQAYVNGHREKPLVVSIRSGVLLAVSAARRFQTLSYF